MGDAQTDVFVEDVAAFVAELRARNYSPRTVQSREESLRRFCDFLRRRGIGRCPDVSRAVVEAYVAELQGSGFSANTIIQSLSALRVFFSALTDRSLIFENPTRGAKAPRQGKCLPAVLSEAEAQAMLAAAGDRNPSGLRDRAMLETLYATAVRRQELMGLRIHDADLASGLLRVMGKGRKERVLPLGRHAAAALERYLSEGRPQLVTCARGAPGVALWLGTHGGPLGYESVARIVARYGRLAGIRRPVGAHTLRRSCATHMLRNGASPIAIQQLLGHASLAHLAQYLRLSVCDLKAMHGASDPGR